MRVPILTIAILIFFSASAQTKKNVPRLVDTKNLNNIKVSNTKAVFLGSTGKVSDLTQLRSTSDQKREKDREVKKIQPNFYGRGKSKARVPELEHQGPDPLRQTKISLNRSPVIIEPIVNIDGLTNELNPQDPTGAVGSNYYVQAINATQIGVFEKNGTLVQEFSGNTLWAPLGESSLGDPIILYDQDVDRWLITEFAEPALLLVAISQTNDPLGSYNVYSFATPDFPDYPKYGIWQGSYIVTTNEESSSSLHQYFIDRNALLAGNPSVTIQRVEIQGNSNTEAGFYITTPVDWNGALAPPDDNPIAVKINDSSWGEVSEDVLEVYTFDVDFDIPTNTTVSLTSIVTTPFDSYPCSVSGSIFECVPQRDGGGLDAIPEVIMNVPHYRNFGTHESIVLNFITDVTNGENLSGIRWMELRRTTGDWELHQEGTFAPDDGLDRYMGSIAMDGNGNIGLAYNVSSPDEYVGLRFTGRFADDPLGVMTVQEREVVAGTNPIQSFSRFGDYAQMNVDPVDESTFWHTSEYAGNGVDDATTRIFSFQLERNANDLAIIELSSPISSPDLGSDETVSVIIQNVGTDAASDFDIVLTFDDIELEVFDFTASLDAGQSYEHTFINTIDLSSFGIYEIDVSVAYASDESSGNNNKTFSVKNIAPNDAAIGIKAEDLICRDEVSAVLRFQNEGANTITSAEIEIFRESTSLGTIDWTGNLETGAFEELSVDYTGLIDGSNNLFAVINSVNGVLDDIPSDNEDSIVVFKDEDFEVLTLELQTDDFPDEIIWGVLDFDNEIVQIGGPYAEPGLYRERICLPKGECFSFVIIDESENGICCDRGTGSYTLFDSQGDVIFESTGQYGASEVTTVCTEDAPLKDISISLQEYENDLCDTLLYTSAQLQNIGPNTITSVSFDVSLNGNFRETIEWEGSLEFGESGLAEIIYDGLNSGMNLLEVEVSAVDGSSDDEIANNTASVDVNVAIDENTDYVSLVLNLDDFPQETLWEFRNENDDLLYSGGPYTFPGQVIYELLCIPSDGCYTISLTDTEGDGICCDFGEGSYQIISSQGQTLLQSDGQFMSSESLELCLGSSCNLQFETSVGADTGDGNGTIIMDASGAGSFSYSIDGGESFVSNGVFNNLEAGTYQVVVVDLTGCRAEAEVEILLDPLSSQSKLPLVIYPNPTDGIFKLELLDIHEIEGFLKVQVINQDGRILQERKFSKYNGSFEGIISLYSYPDGVYFIRLLNTDSRELVRIIKE